MNLEVKEKPNINAVLYRKLAKLVQPNSIKEGIFRIFLLILFSGLIYVLLYPVIYIFSTATKSPADMLDSTCVWIAKHPSFETYKNAFNLMGFTEGFKNSIILALGTAIIQVASCSVIGYGLARFKFREKNIIFLLIMVTLIIPPQTIVVPLFAMFKNFDVLGISTLISGSGINTLDSNFPFMFPALFGCGLKSGFFIYIYRQFFSGMPKELEEAAYIDGCGVFRTFLKVMLPNAVPAIATVFLFSLVWHWNDVFEPSMFLQSPDKYPLGTRILNITGYILKGGQIQEQTSIIPTKYAGIALAILPMIVLYLFAQKYFVESVERSGIVG